MATYHERLSELAPTAQMTLISLVQAISLERLVDALTEVVQAGATPLELTACLATGGLVFLGIVIIWLVYAQVLCVLTWNHHPVEALVPFFIGLMQFTIIGFLRPATHQAATLLFGVSSFLALGLWLYALYHFRREPENRELLAFDSRAMVSMYGVATFIALAVGVLPLSRLSYAALVLANGFATLGLVLWTISWWGFRLRSREASET